MDVLCFWAAIAFAAVLGWWVLGNLADYIREPDAEKAADSRAAAQWSYILLSILLGFILMWLL